MMPTPVVYSLNGCPTNLGVIRVQFEANLTSAPVATPRGPHPEGQAHSDSSSAILYQFPAASIGRVNPQLLRISRDRGLEQAGVDLPRSASVRT